MEFAHFHIRQYVSAFDRRSSVKATWKLFLIFFPFSDGTILLKKIPMCIKGSILKKSRRESA
jgi:hypothetical protein